MQKPQGGPNSERAFEAPAFDYSRLPRDFPRKFVPRGMPFDWDSLSELYEDLKSRQVKSEADLEKWMADEDELSAVICEQKALAMVNYSRQTDDAAYRQAYERFVQELEPKVKLASFELLKKYASSPLTKELPAKYSVTDRVRRNTVEIFREANVQLEKEEAQLIQNYQSTMGKMTVPFGGSERTIQQMAKFLEEVDRGLREETWRLTQGRLQEDAAALDDIYSRMVKVRTAMAKNAGYSNYRDYAFRLKNRFDYTPEDCVKFHDAVEKYFVPLSRELDEERRRRMGLDVLRPWDLQVDPDGRQPLAPFDRTEELLKGCVAIFDKVDPTLSSYFRRMVSLGLLDLESRKGKAPGGFQDEFSEVRLPFIFMNSAKRDGDMRTLLHESGHSFHSFLMRDAGLPFYDSGQNIPAEFAEVASSGMEHIGGEHLEGTFYGPKEARRSAWDEAVSTVKLFPWVATVDAFQHWVYTNPDHTVKERADAWTRIFRRFQGAESFEGLEPAMRVRWQRQLHIYQFPFYYIEYGIAYLGGLGIWMHYRKDPKGAVAAYKRALSLGYTKPLPELFRSAGLPWDFGPETLEKYSRELRGVIKQYS